MLQNPALYNFYFRGSPAHQTFCGFYMCPLLHVVAHMTWLITQVTFDQEIYVNWKVWFTPKRYMATTSETTSSAAAGKVKTCHHPLQVSIANPVISHAFTNGTLRMKISQMIS